MNSKTENAIMNWVKATVELLVDDPAEIKMEFVEGVLVSVINITVAKEDLGKLIGKHGIMADAFRTIIQGYAGRIKKRYVLNIVA